MGLRGQAVRGAGAALWVLVAACRNEAPNRGGLGGQTNGTDVGVCHAGAGGGACSAPGDSELDAGPGPAPTIPDASLLNGLRQRRLCGFDGEQFTTYLFPTGERLRSLNVKNQFRSLGPVIGIDAARGELLATSCSNSPDVGSTLVQHSACSLDRLSASAAGLAAPIQSIRLERGENIASVVVDPVTGSLIALVQERDAEGVVSSARVLTLARDAVDLAAPISRLDTAPGDSLLGLDAESGELYVNRDGQNVRVFARDASAGTQPLRIVSFPYNEPDSMSPVRGEYYRMSAGFETYALPLTTPVALPSRTLTGDFGGFWLIDDANGELWTPTGVYDLTASGEAIRRRSPPSSFGFPMGAFPQGDEMAFQSIDALYLGGPVAFYPRTAIDGAPRRVLESAPFFKGGHELTSIDVQRQEVFFLREDGLVTVYALDATADAAPLRRLSTSLRVRNTRLDPVTRELLGTTREQLDDPVIGFQDYLMAYPAGDEGDVTATRRLRLEYRYSLQPENQYAGAYDFLFGEIDSVHEQLLGVARPSSGVVADLSDKSNDPSYVAYSLTNGSVPYPVTRISSWRGPRSLRSSSDPTESQGRHVDVIDFTYDSRRDEVVLALKDCFYEAGEYTSEHSDCYHELRSYPRTAGGGDAFNVLEMPEEIRALDYDAENDMLMVSGQTSVLFLAPSQQTGNSGTSMVDAGPIAGEPASEFPFAGTFHYCD
ncbi:MAG: hypothetical protein ABI895_34385 [Deltaproteobacteria bacterium]